VSPPGHGMPMQSEAVLLMAALLHASSALPDKSSRAALLGLVDSAM
jgi:hypothetical protein